MHSSECCRYDILLVEHRINTLCTQKITNGALTCPILYVHETCYKPLILTLTLTFQVDLKTLSHASNSISSNCEIEKVLPKVLQRIILFVWHFSKPSERRFCRPEGAQSQKRPAISIAGPFY